MTVSSAVIKVLVINENIRENEDPERMSPALAIKESLDHFFKLSGNNGFILEAVTIIGSPKAAIDKLAEFKPDIVLIDCWGLENVKFDDLIIQLQISPDGPKKIIPINIDPIYHKNILTSTQNRCFKYTEKDSNSLAKLVDILENIQKG